MKVFPKGVTEYNHAVTRLLIWAIPLLLWNHQTQSDETLAPSVREFVMGLREHEEWKS